MFPAFGSVPGSLGHVFLLRRCATGRQESDGADGGEQKRFEFSHRLILEQNLVAFHHFVLFPFGKDVGDDRCKRARWREDHGGDPCPDCEAHTKRYATQHTEAISSWMSVKANANWAKTTQQGDCGIHHRNHTVADCLHDEMKYWALRSSGRDEKEAKAQVFDRATVASR